MWRLDWPACSSKRVVTDLADVAFEGAIPCLTVEASITALPFFLRHQFVIVSSQEVERGGQALKNFAMARHLETTPPS